MKVFLVMSKRENSLVTNISNNKDFILLNFVDRPVLAHLAEYLTQNGITMLYILKAVCEANKELFDIILKDFPQLKYQIIYEPSINESTTTVSLFPTIKKYINPDESFILLNDRIICNIPIEKHFKAHGNNPTVLAIAFVCVQDEIGDKDAHYRCAESNTNNHFQDIINKKIFSCNPDTQNTGIYIFKPEILSKASIHKCDISPEQIEIIICSDNEFCFDIGSAKGYLYATNYFLNTNKDIPEPKVITNPTATIADGCVIGSDVVIGPNSKIEKGVRLKNTIVMGDSEIQMGSYIENAILGLNTKVGKWTRISGNISVLSNNVEVHDGVYISGCFVFPHKKVSTTTVGKNVLL